MYRYRKGQGLTMDVIIIAAISLVVLVVLIAIFTGKLGQFTREIKDCGAQGGVCMTNDDCKERDGAILPGKTSCDENSGAPKCCIQTEKRAE